MKPKRPYVLTLSGFDPSNGAGLTADVQTINSLKCYAVSVCTANTIQTDTEFMDCHWMDKAVVLKQTEVLLKRFQPQVVKVGIIENWQVLGEVVELIVQHTPKAKIILDPVMKSSSGFTFNEGLSAVSDVLEKLYLITPNQQELNPTNTELLTAITAKANVLLTGGHDASQPGKDILYTKSGKQFSLNPKLKNCTEKHGSGCVLSSAIAAYTAQGYPLLKACLRAKKHTEKILSSNASLLAYHA